MKEVQVASLGLDKSSNTPVVILRETDGQRILPIWIGPNEASAIAMELAGIKFSRPLTHDLFNTVVVGLGSELVRVMITKVIDNTYFASLIFEHDGELISIDSRPSDSVALALRAAAPIYADDELLDTAALDMDPTNLETGLSDPGWSSDTAGAEPTEQTKETEKTHERLRDYLKGLNPEDFGRFNP
jgi:hypothetical protein